MTRPKDPPAEPHPDSFEGIEARATAQRCAEQIREYWKRRGYDVPIQIKGTRIVMPPMPGGFPPPEMKLP